jgi:hypothetical protein
MKESGDVPEATNSRDSSYASLESAGTGVVRTTETPSLLDAGAIDHR